MTTETTYTPGPWRADVDALDYPEMYLTVSEMDGASLLERGALVCQDDEVNHSNARLIAAAPDLYEALKDTALREFDGPCWCRHLPVRPASGGEGLHYSECLSARAAIARAEGREPRPPVFVQAYSDPELRGEWESEMRNNG